MEMCYDGALVMPSSFAVVDADEMMYLEGGARKKVYKGAKGWAVAATLSAVGATMSQLGRKTVVAALPYITGMLAGGPAGWLAAGITSVIGGIACGTIIYFGGQFASAGAQALYYMKKKGKFTLKLNNNPFSLITVS